MSNNREIVFNSANKAASERRFEPGSFGYSEEILEGVFTKKLAGGHTLWLMRNRPVLESSQTGDDQHDLMVLVRSDTDKASEAGIVRINDTSYAIMQDGEEGTEITPLDQFGNIATRVMLDGSEIQVLYRFNNDELIIMPGRFGDPGSFDITATR